MAANLGTAWQMAGDLKQAASRCRRLFAWLPEASKRAEELHLKLVRLRLQKKGLAEIEELFGVNWLSDKGEYVPGKLRTPAQETARRRGGPGSAAWPVAARGRPAAVAAGGTRQHARRFEHGGGHDGGLHQPVRHANEGIDAQTPADSRSRRGPHRRGRARYPKLHLQAALETAAAHQA